MVTKSDIDTDLALELEGNEDSKKFLKAVTAFIKYVEEVAKISAGDEAPTNWTVQVKEANNLVGLQPAFGFNPAIIARTYATFERGISSIREGVLPEDHSEEALSYLRKIGEVADKKASPRIWIERKPIEVTQKVAVSIKKHLAENYYDYGSVEGLLQVISEREIYRAEITDPLDNKPVRCILNEALMKDALKMFGDRVQAYGKIKYRADGTIVNITVEELTPFLPPYEIPSFKDVKGIFEVS